MFLHIELFNRCFVVGTSIMSRVIFVMVVGRELVIGETRGFPLIIELKTFVYENL